MEYRVLINESDLDSNLPEVAPPQVMGVGLYCF